MTVLAQNTAEGGTAGAAVAAGGTGSGSPWDAVINASGVITYDNTHVDVGALAYKVAMLTASCRVEWNATTLGAGTLTELFFATDFHFTGSPTSSCHLVEGVTNAAAQAWALDIASTGKLFIRNSANTNLYTSTMTLPVNSWCRIEAHVVHNGASGAIQVRIFSNYTDTAPAEDSGVLTSNLGTDTSRLYLGAFTSSTALPPYWFGEPRVGNTANGGSWLGPAAAAGQAAAAADQVGVTEQVSAAVDAARAVADQVGVTEQVSAVLSSAGNAAAADPVAISEAVTAAWSRAVAVSDTVGITDATVTGTPIIAALATVRPLSVAHRGGFGATLGEETLEAYTAAAAQYSKAFLEVSVWQCSTGEYVCSHDSTTGRVFSGASLTITSSTWAALSGKTTINGGNPIRRLTDILDAFPGRFFVIDNKQDTNAATLIALLNAHAPGRWMGKQFYTAAATWLTACQDAGAPVWAYFYPADLGNLATAYGNLSLAKSPVVFGLGDYSAAPVPVQSDANTFLGFVTANGLLCWADILNTIAQRSTADNQATTAGHPFDGYMTSGFAAVAPTDQPAPADPVGIAETVTAAADRSRAPADPVGVSDAATTAADLIRPAADRVDLTESVTAVSDRARTAADSVGVTDAATTAADLSRPADDPVGVTEQVMTGAGIVRSAAETVAVTDSVTAETGHDRAAADPVGVTDAAVASVGYQRSAVDQVDVTEFVAVAADRDRDPADQLGVTETVSISLAWDRAAADQVAVTETVTAVLHADETVGADRDITLTISTGTDRWSVNTGTDRWAITTGDSATVSDQDQTIELSAGAVEYTYIRTVVETTGQDISADDVAVALRPAGGVAGDWTSPEIERGTMTVADYRNLTGETLPLPDATVLHWAKVKTLIGPQLVPPPAAGTYYLHVRISDSPETVPRQTPGRIIIA